MPVPRRFSVLVLLFTTSCGGCGGRSRAVRIEGSSTVAPISEAVAEEYGKSHFGVRLTVGVSGTSGGFKKLCAGEIDIAGASRPIKPAEAEACRAAGIGVIELPVAYDGVAVVVHPSNSFAQSITVSELRKLWHPDAEQHIRRWSQVRAGWPDTEIHLFGPGVESGTYDFFTEAVIGKEGASRGDFTSSEDDNVLVQGVSHDPGALGFFGFGYYEENLDKLKLVAIDDERAENGDGPTLPSPTSILDGSYEPLSRPVFVYVSRASSDRPEVRELVSYYLQQSALIDEVGYVPLSPRALALVKERWAARTQGSLFAGHEAHGGGSVEALLER